MKKEKKTKKERVQVEDKQLNENISKLEKEIKNKKELPKEEILKINKKVFVNIFIADIIMVFLVLISLGALNIETTAFITDLKVFSVAFIILTIILFEISYKKDDGNICIHGIETLVLAIFTLLSIYTYTIYFKNFHMIVASVSLLFGVYYVGKAIVIYKKMKKQYLASVNDISEIIKK